MNEYKNIHSNQDIYVIGSGKSCDFIDQSFFENKITIGINQVFKKFDCKYYIRKEKELIEYVIDNINDNSKLFITNGKYGGDNLENKDFINKNLNENKKKKIIMLEHYKNCSFKIDKIKKTDFFDLDKNIKKNKLITSSSTICTGIHLAYYMGAKNIILVGHDCCLIDKKSNFNGYHTDKTLSFAHKNGQKDYNKWLSKIESHTIHIKKILKELDVNVYSLNPFVSYNLEGHKLN